MYKGQTNENETDRKKVCKMFIISKVIIMIINTFIPLWEKTVNAFMEKSHIAIAAISLYLCK